MVKMNRWLVLLALPLLGAACARGGEGDAGAALTDTTSATGLSTDTAAPAPVATPAVAPAEMDSAAAAHTADTTVQADSAAHP